MQRLSLIVLTLISLALANIYGEVSERHPSRKLNWTSPDPSFCKSNGADPFSGYKCLQPTNPLQELMNREEIRQVISLAQTMIDQYFGATSTEEEECLFNQIKHIFTVNPDEETLLSDLDTTKKTRGGAQPTFTSMATYVYCKVSDTKYVISTTSTSAFQNIVTLAYSVAGFQNTIVMKKINNRWVSVNLVYATAT